ncbi:MAG: elongation factor Ts [Candidatus Omnitrophica bacterium]|nr:elongation factor Ts [Candidatus Omnitrophota bacterium]
MEVSLEAIKELRKMTSAGISDCKEALIESQGDINKAIEILRKKGFKKVERLKDQEARQGRIESYVHFGNRLGALVEINCQTDFAARSKDFIQFCEDIALQIVAYPTEYINKEDVPEEVLKGIEDKETFFKESCLLEQSFIKEPSMTIKDYLCDIIAKLGENVVIRRFVRYELGK